MDNTNTKKEQIKEIISKFIRFDKIIRSSFLAVLAIMAVFTILISHINGEHTRVIFTINEKNFDSSPLPIFIIFSGVICLIVAILSIVWSQKKGYVYTLEYNKLIEEVYGAVAEQEKEQAAQLQAEGKRLISSTWGLIKKCKLRRAVITRNIKAEIEQVLQGIGYGVRPNATEMQALQAKIAKYADIIFDSNADKEESENFIAKFSNVVSRVSYELD